MFPERSTALQIEQNGLSSNAPGVSEAKGAAPPSGQKPARPGALRVGQARLAEGGVLKSKFARCFAVVVRLDRPSLNAARRPAFLRRAHRGKAGREGHGLSTYPQPFPAIAAIQRSKTAEIRGFSTGPLGIRGLDRRESGEMLRSYPHIHSRSRRGCRVLKFFYLLDSRFGGSESRGNPPFFSTYRDKLGG